MHLSVMNWMKRRILLLFPMFVLTACSGKEELFLEPDGQEEVWKTEEVSDFSAMSGEDAASAEESGGELEENAGSESKLQEIYVHICGAVVNPGVYVLTAGSRIFEGIEAAGGFLENACKDYVNLAKPLQDGQQLAIPTMEEVETAKQNGIYQELWLTEAENTEGATVVGESGASSADGDGLININMATENELGSINGIGPSKAAAIVAYRKENGGFSSIEEIMKVSGIGESTYEKIKGRITVN